MKFRNKKLFNTMVLGVLAILLAFSHNVHATNIYKCAKGNGQVVYQDFACTDNQIMEMHKVEMNQSADTNVGLRDYEKVVLARIFEKQLLAMEKR